MSRSLDHGDGELRRQQQNNQDRMSLGRGGSSSEAEERPDHADRRSTRGNAGDSNGELAGLIDRAAADRPTMSVFVERLEKNGVYVVPSIQSSGRLNGMSYQFKGVTVKGSRLGRQYTAQGLQRRKGIQYDAARDDGILRLSLERAGFRRSETNDSRADLNRGTGGGREARGRERSTGLSADQKATLAEVGKFRALKSDDLIKHRYEGNVGRFRQDMRILAELGLAERRTIRHLKSGQDYDVVVLTQKGRNDLRKRESENPDALPGQQFHAGFVKPAEIRHDTGIYSMYQAEQARIQREGGTVKRVVLDFELKKKVFGELNRTTDRSDPDYMERKKEIAEENGLKVIEGRIVFPDLRIEYERAGQETSKVDLELATGDYKNSQVQAKHAAGLRIYAPDSALGSPAFQDPEIVAGLISL